MGSCSGLMGWFNKVGAMGSVRCPFRALFEVVDQAPDPDKCDKDNAHDTKT